MPAVSFEPTKQTLGQILGSTSPPIRVPEYQRDFSWQPEQVLEFWNDLLAFERELKDEELDGREYFLGACVLVTTKQWSLLLDGQQRLATATILLGTLRDSLRESDKETANQLQELYIRFTDRLSGRTDPFKLRLNKFDKDFFERAIQDFPSGDEAQPKQRSHRLILSAKKLFGREIDRLRKDAGGKRKYNDRLRRIAHILTEGVSLVVVRSNDEDHAASIFETLNDRGIGLSTADLLRSWLLKTAEPDTDHQIIDLWGEIFRACKTDKVENVIRLSWLSRYGDVKARALYKIIKDELTQQRAKSEPNSDSLNFTRAMHQDALFHQKICAGHTTLPTIDEVCRGLRSVRGTSGYTVLLAANRELDPKDCDQVSKALAALVVRHNVVCKRDRAKFETAAFEAAKSISESGKLAKALAIFRKLSPTDDEFKASFEGLQFKPQQIKIATILLRTIENYRTDSGEKVLAGTRDVHLDHVYPLNPRSGMRLTDHDNIVNRFGNLTLLSAKLNQEAQNSPFAEKKSNHYCKSEIKLTQDLMEFDRWDAAAMSDRQRSLCDHALAVWPASLV